MRRRLWLWAAAIFAMGLAQTVRAAETPEFTPKITDVTVFKDGHALVVARGQAKLADGWCRTRAVPAPVLGTFWAFAADPECEVNLVKAGVVPAEETRPCLTLEEIIQANKGKRATLTEQAPGAAQGNAVTHEGILLGLLQQEPPREGAAGPAAEREEENRYVRSVSSEEGPEKSRAISSFVMVETQTGVALIRRENIRSVVLADKKPATTMAEPKQAREIAFRVASKGKPADGEREVGLVYLQKGLRWIPDYRVELLADGKAKLSLQATVLNELADLADADVRLVVGVPSFLMENELSPLALRETGPKLSSFFLPPSRGTRAPRLTMFNTQRANIASVVEEAPVVAAANLAGEGQTEDLFLYHVPHVTLKKGERAALKLLEATVAYEHIYAWDIPPVPPRELWRHFGEGSQRQMATLLLAPVPMHKIRLSNTTPVPWTTGPAAVFKSGTLLGQQLMTFTSVKNRVDVGITVATDLHTRKEETELKREPNLIINREHYTKVSLHGTLTLTNFKDKAVRVVVTRSVFGAVTAATADGKITQTNVLEDASRAEFESYPWASWNWPLWWHSANPMSRVTWEATVPAGKSITLEYDWHYFHQ